MIAKLDGGFGKESISDCGGLRKVESWDQDFAILPGVFINKFGSFPTFSPLTKLCEENVVKSVSRFIDDKVSNNGHAQEVEITNEVKYFVADKLVSVAKTVGVENAKIIQDNGVIQRASLGETVIFQGLDVFEETKSASSADLFHKGGTGEAQYVSLF